MAPLRLILVGLLLALPVRAQETPAPSASPTPRKVRISFLPPPVDGLISLGIYDRDGKLVRVLQREAELEEFEAGNDALQTAWDGKNDAGEPLPSGKYFARGYAVDADAEGVGYFFNDWVEDENSLRIARVTAVELANGLPLLSVQLADGRALSILCDLDGNIMNTGEVRTRQEDCGEALSCAPGREETRWVIEQVSPEATEVKQLSKSGELLRRLSVPAGEPQPRQLAASPDSDSILLLEENSQAQRVRSLVLAGKNITDGQATSDWKVQFEKTITAHHDFTMEKGEPVPAGGTPLLEKIAVKLQPNPLAKNQRTTVELTVAFDADGSFLRTADGLPLLSISETKKLQRIGLAPAGENAAEVLQDDGVVVEQFHLTDLAKMAAFDAGEIELK